ncbi:YcnI family protein [Couchioplanes caeruleus]|uniref:YcnI family copper-binding membrane protein n=1 Tax=Couchioplanes caeruleus TaxID=56438 RepID=UPI0020BFF737|nr:YcnI family protein [Couchioplanes caeruleus]UQU61987.1 YcnI family protein [Couchioplanes caeruleus]
MSLLKRSGVVGGIAAACTFALAVPAAAHVTVNPNTAVQGGYAKVTFRVPNETDSAATTKVEVNLPTDTPFASVSLKPVAGWTMVAQKSKLAKPIEAHGAQISEAVSKITWTAAGDAAIKPGQFQEFDVSLGPLPEVDQVVFKALQTYSDGTVVRWIDEPATDGTEPEKPAPVLKLTPAGAPGADAPAAAPGPSVAAVADDGDDEDGSGGTWTGVAGIVLGLAGLVLGLLAYRRAQAASGAAAAAAEPATE